MGLILFVAELGAGFGHVRRMLPVAQAAAAGGHRPLFLVGNPAEVASLVAGAGLELQAAPTRAALGAGPADSAARGSGAGAVATSHGDLLGAVGFADRELLREAVGAWDAALARLGPAAVVCEHSPFLALACFGADLPLLALGHGFVLPPPHLDRFPPLRGQAPTPIHDEGELLANAVAVCRARDREGPPALPALLGGTAHAVTGLSILDPYRGLRRQPAVGPPRLGVEPVEDSAGEELFIYLAGDAPSTAAILRGAAASGLAGRAFVRRATEAHRQALSGGRIAWLERPAPIREALARARVILHHGSMALTEEALAAGRPQVVAPFYLEHLLTARVLLEAGVAEVLRSTRDPAATARTLLAAVADRARATRARALAAALQRDAPPLDLPAALLGSIGIL